jgi:hypothetical protein
MNYKKPICGRCGVRPKMEGKRRLRSSDGGGEAYCQECRSEMNAIWRASRVKRTTEKQFLAALMATGRYYSGAPCQ